MIVFENPGIFDLKALTTFGVSVKNTDNPIGMFGTGSKYAISIFLRNGFNLKMITGGQEYKFGLESSSIRGKTFDIIKMNDIEMPFTTHLGMNWELWQAFREFHCNATDEGGDSYYSNDEPRYSNEKTYFIVEGSGDHELFQQKGQIILNDRIKIELDEVDIIEKPSNFMYYRGIRVMGLQRPASLTYNIKRALTLTEDRTLRAGDWASQAAIVNSIVRCTNKSVIRKVVLQKHDTFEKTLSFGAVKYTTDISQEFVDVVKEEFENNNDDLNSTLKDWISDITASHRFKHIKEFALNNSESEMFKKAQRIVSSFFPNASYPVIFCETLGRTTKAFADKEESKVYLSRDCFEAGSLFLASTLLEEFTHLYESLDDETRALQTFLFDKLTMKIAKEVGVVI